MVRYVVLSAMLLSLAACSPKTPAEQKAYAARLSDLHHRWSAEKGNDLRQAPVEEEARAFLRQPVHMVKWRARVESVGTLLGDEWISATGAGLKFMIKPPSGSEKRFHEAAVALSPGDEIEFSGDSKGEVSMTLIGAFTEPEFVVTLSWIHRL